MASRPSSCQGASVKSPQHQKGAGSNFEPLDKAASNTLKRNPKMELSKPDLLKLLSYLEGELEAREVVIAALKSEKVKQLLHQSRHKPGTLTQSQLALQLDSFAVADSRLGLDCLLSDRQMATLDNVILQHRRAQLRMAKLVKDMETQHCKVVHELDEEKRKHEHDTAQGDDITYELEKERTRLKQELELQKQARKKQEKDLEKANDVLREERNRQKQIVLLLLAERKKLLMKYVEERRRSEDLAQIVSEEKVQMNAMADGLEEESKKSLQMEAELEKQIAQFELERQHLKSQVMREQRRISELEGELEKSKAEQTSLHKQLAEAHQVAMFQASVNTSCPNIVAGAVKGAPWVGLPDGEAGPPLLSSVAKVVQPTATVSSVPVCAPTTGIARSVSPGQSSRSVLFSPSSITSPAFQLGEADQSNVVVPRAPAAATSPAPAPASATASTPAPAPAPAAKLFATSTGGKLTFHVSAAAEGDPGPPPKKSAGGRGAPPPVPPNKPVVPPKKESVVSRKAPAPQVGVSRGADSLHAAAAARPASPPRAQVTGPIDIVATSTPSDDSCRLSKAPVPAPATAFISNPNPSPVPDTVSPSSLSSSVSPDLLPECLPSRPPTQSELSDSLKVDAV